MSTLPVNPNHRSTIRISPELIKKTDHIIEKASLNTLFDEQISEQAKQEFEQASKEDPFSPEQIQEILLRFPLVIAQQKLLIIKLKQDQLIDSELAALLCASLKEFNIAREQNSINQKNKRKLDKILNLIKQKLIKLVSTKQIEPLLVQPLIHMLFLINVYMKTVNIIQ
jgi:hypothetical protein